MKCILGMPLIEVVTEACFKSPEEAARGVRHIGRLLRVSGKVRRGIGAVRQDVNVSIEGGRRVEIKGVPRYQLIPALTRIEALRQKVLLDIRMDELKRRGLKAETLETFDADMSGYILSAPGRMRSKSVRPSRRCQGVTQNRNGVGARIFVILCLFWTII